MAMTAQCDNSTEGLMIKREKLIGVAGVSN